MFEGTGKKWIFGCIVVLAVYFACFRSTDWSIKNSPAEGRVVACFGDSLVSGVGAEKKSKSYPSQLALLLGSEVESFGATGETAKRALLRLNQVKAVEPDLVVVTLGGNDILRKVPIEESTNALRRIFTELQNEGAIVAFTGLAPPLKGKKRMDAIKALCAELGVLWIPSVMKGLWGSAKMYDYIHPNGEGYKLVAERVHEAIVPHLPGAD